MANNYLDIDDNEKLVNVVDSLQKKFIQLEEEKQRIEDEKQAKEFVSRFVTKEDFDTKMDSFSKEVKEGMVEGLTELYSIMKGDKMGGPVSDKIVPKTQSEGRTNDKLASDENLQTAYDQKPDEKNSASGPGNDGGDETSYVLKESDDKKEDDDGGDSTKKVKDIEDKITTLQNEKSALMQKMVGAGATPLDEASDSSEDKEEKKEDKKDDEGDKQKVQVSQDPLLSKANVLLEAAKAISDPLGLGDNKQFDDGLGTLAQYSNVYKDEETLMKELHEIAMKGTPSGNTVEDAAQFVADWMNKEQSLRGTGV